MRKTFHNLTVQCDFTRMKGFDSIIYPSQADKLI